MSRRRRIWRTARLVLVGLLLAIALAPAVGEVVLQVGARAGRFPAADLAHDQGESRRILDADGHVLREAVGSGGARAEWLPLDEVPPLFLAATIAAEDERFYLHDGVDRTAVLRAVGQDLAAGGVRSGASTITMQLVRLLHPHRRTVWGKIGEMIDAMRLERVAGKREILEQYVNRAPYGAGTVGVEAASRRYLGKPAAHLSLAEAALLAALPNSPTRLNPFANPDAALRRRRYVLARMHETGAIDDGELARALAEPLVLVPPQERPRAMHFTDWVLAMSPTPGEVRTTLDGDLQAEVERLTVEHVRSLAGAGVSNSAVVVLDNETCAVKAMVGSVDYWGGPDGAVNGALARRQPGSALKPFVYALAFAGGDSPASVVPDVETTWGRAGAPGYSPRNYDGTFAGPVLMGDALGRSLNVPAVRTADRVGVEALLAKLHELGFASLDQPAGHYGLGLALGDGEVELVELAQAYAALARGGLTCHASPFPGGGAPGVRAFSPEVSWLVTDVLSDEMLRVAAFGPANSLLLGFPVAVKTGTSSNWRDSWAVGYTDRYTVAVWSGDFSGRPLRRVAGANGAGLLFHRVMRLAVERGGAAATPVKRPPPPGVVEMTVCALSGHRAGPRCPHRRVVHLLADHAPPEICEWHRDVAIDRRNQLLAGPDCPAQFVEQRAATFLPSEYAEWAASTGWPAPPTAESPLCPLGGGAAGAVTVTSPSAGDVFVIEPGYDPRTQSLPLSARVDPPVDQVTWFVDGHRAAVASWPYRAEWVLTPGNHEIIAAAGARRSDPVTIQVR